MPDERMSRRKFTETAAAGSAAIMATPLVLTAKKTASSLTIGSGQHQYEVIHDWPQLPEKYSWQTTHNVAVDKSENLYVIHEGDVDKPDHPAIFVFDNKGAFVRAFGNQFQGGGHGLEVRQEGSEEFLYICCYQQLKTFAKLTLTGEIVWQKWAPMESGVYAANEDSKPENIWGRDRFLPTNFAFLDDGGFFLSDGYGSFHIHRYDKDANYVSSFGGPTDTKEHGLFDTPHGIWIDRRPNRAPSVVIADRANGRLQWFTLEGEHLRTMDGYLFPANIDTLDELMLVPDLHARITLLDGQDQVVAQLGEDIAWRSQVLDGFKLRKEPTRWQAGKFLHPHDACFDPQGNIFVAEWVATGRITKLRPLA
jgi:hypothetical protein